MTSTDDVKQLVKKAMERLINDKEKMEDLVHFARISAKLTEDEMQAWLRLMRGHETFIKNMEAAHAAVMEDFRRVHQQTFDDVDREHEKEIADLKAKHEETRKSWAARCNWRSDRIIQLEREITVLKTKHAGGIEKANLSTPHHVCLLLEKALKDQDELHKIISLQEKEIEYLKAKHAEELQKYHILVMATVEKARIKADEEAAVEQMLRPQKKYADWSDGIDTGFDICYNEIEKQLSELKSSLPLPSHGRVVEELKRVKE